jgi:hypothetical protein
MATLPHGDVTAPVAGLRDGFRSQTVIIPGEDPSEYTTLLGDLATHFQPTGLSETRFVREMADGEWRLRRIRAIQEEMLAARCEDFSAMYPGIKTLHLHAGAYNSLLKETGFAHFLRYEIKFERQFDRATKGLLAARKDAAARHRSDRTQPPPSPGRPSTNAKPRASATGRPTPTEPRASASGPRIVTDEANSVPRNAACPCGSGLKFKRCCGRSAPPVLKTPRN